MNIKVNKNIRLTSYRKTDIINLVLHISEKEIYDNTLSIPFPYTEQDANDWRKVVRRKRMLTRQQNDWVIRDHEEGLIGGIALLNGYKENFKDEIGYWLAKPFWGQGIMTEVIKTFTDFCFEKRGIVRIQANTFAHNTASIKVLKKSGFEEEGRMKKNYLKDGKFYNGVLLAKTY